MTPLYKFAQPLQFAKTSPTQFAEFGARTKMLTNVFPCWLGCNWCWRPTIVITAATSHTAGDTLKHQQHAAKIDRDYLNIIKFFYVNLLYFAFLTCLDVGLLCSFRIFANFHSIIVCMVKYIGIPFEMDRKPPLEARHQVCNVGSMCHNVWCGGIHWWPNLYVHVQLSAHFSPPLH